MADSPASPTVTPSSLNAPKNGASSPVQQPAEPKQPATAAPDPLADREAKLKAREEALAKREKTFGNELQKYKSDNKGLGAKLSEYEQLKKWKSEADTRAELRKLNPVAALEEDFGKDWREKLTALSVNGVPPTDLIAEALKRFEQRIDEKLANRDRQTQEQATAAERAEIEATRARVAGESSAFYESNANNYPVFERLGDAQRIGEILGQRIEQNFMRTGKVMTPKEAADALESDMLGIAETATKSEKYRDRLQPGTKPANHSEATGKLGGGGSTNDSPGSTRRTLSNDLTASSSGRAPPRSDEERMARSIAAFNAVASRAKS